MAYTTVGQVSAMLPTFVRGNAQQAPSDSNITIWISDIAGEINAVLIRRFTESINSAPSNGNFALWVSLLSADAIAILEKINRYGACAQLLLVLATLGSASTLKLAMSTEKNFKKMWNDLNARDEKGLPMASGMYDAYFDPLSRVETPRPGIEAISGVQCGQDDNDNGQFLFRIHEVI